MSAAAAIRVPQTLLFEAFMQNTAVIFDKKKGHRLAEMRYFGCALHWFTPSIMSTEKPMCSCVNSHEMAKLLGVSQSHLSRLETGKVEKSDFTLAKMIGVFGEEKTAYVLAGLNPGKFQRPRGKKAYVRRW